MRAALLAAALAAAGGQGALAAPRAEFMGSILLPSGDPLLGGLSGLQFSPDGRDFIALSDRGGLAAGEVERDEGGAVVGIRMSGPVIVLRGREGLPLDAPYGDSEGLRIAADGSLLISFEQMHRVAHYRIDGSLIDTLPVPLPFAGFPANSGFEALALAADGSVYAIPEGDAAGQADYPIYRLRGGAWAQAGVLRGAGTFRPVDAQFGPDGRLYVLERDFWPLLGFQTRLRRVTLGPDGVAADEPLLETRAGRFGNLEGLSLWQDEGGGLHATMVSDDNFLPVQVSQFVDWRLAD
ncbi:MAG: esterase-like activity of phytase family protein [Proteobacteria bacterium]|nr:esterase-like activity of phytase family protein [Pseudomonadota bacterium]